MADRETLLEPILTALSGLSVGQQPPFTAFHCGDSHLEIACTEAKGLYLCEFYRHDVPSATLITDSHEYVLACANAWLREHANLREIKEWCAQFQPLPAGLALEEGTLREFCWATVERAVAEIREVALAARDQPALQALYPSFSMNSLRLARVYSGPDSRSVVKVRPASTGGFEVCDENGRIVGSGDACWAIATMTTLVEEPSAGDPQSVP
jgi:hypothetical protein